MRRLPAASTYPGNSYDDVGNGNVSAIHRDLVLIQTPEYGGGEIWFDDVLIRKDGLYAARAGLPESGKPALKGEEQTDERS